jgi:hypothetical protein
MSELLLSAVGIVTVVVIIVAAAFALRRRKPETQTSDLEKAWADYVSQPPEWPRRDRRAVERIPQLEDGVMKTIKASIRNSVDSAMATQDPMVSLRKAVMDATDRFILAEMLHGSQEAPGGTAESSSEMPMDHLESVIEAGVLRRLAALRFQDFGEEDWYSHYLNVAEMNSRNVAEMVRKTVRGDLSSLETSLHEPLTRAMRQVRESLLGYPARIPVERAVKLADQEGTIRLRPTQKQLDRLANVMSERLEKLFAGQGYRVMHGTPVNPAGAFRIDAGLLYTQLAIKFRYAADAWNQIMGEALGPYREVMQGEEQLLETATDLHRIWVESEDGPLHAVLRSCGSLAFDVPSESVDQETMVSSMAEDAGPLVNHILDAIEEK